MRKWATTGLAALLLAGNVSAMDVRYGAATGLVGTLVDRQGVDCCMNGKEKKVTFPALLLDQPINVTAANPQALDEDETPEQGVKLLQLAISDESLWKAFKQHKGKRARVTCSLFHAVNGHHLTAVLCDVQQITRPDQY